MHTLLLIKPNATRRHVIGEILAMVEARGFSIDALKMFTFDHDLAAQFYAEHQGRDFYERLVSFMMSGTTVAALLSHPDAVHELRDLVGNTDPALAREGSIRRRYGETVTLNAVHASDSPEHALAETRIIFPELPNIECH